jgi:hypothetical protein
MAEGVTTRAMKERLRAEALHCDELAARADQVAEEVVDLETTSLKG